MRKNIFLLGAVMFFISFCFVSFVSAETSVPSISVDAQNTEYDMENKSLLAEGDVKVESRNFKLFSDFMKVDLNKNIIHAWGNVLFSRNEGSLRGTEVTYNMNEGCGEVKGISGEIEYFIIEGDSLDFSANGKAIISNGSITACELPNPCYLIRAQRITFIPNKELRAYRVTLYIKGIPIITLPTYMVSLSPSFSGHNDTPYPYIKIAYRNKLGVTFEYKQGFAWTPRDYGAIRAYYAYRRGLDLNLSYERLIGQGLYAGIEMIREAYKEPMLGLAFAFKRDVARHELDSKLIYYYRKGLQGNLNYTANLPGDFNINLRAMKEIDTPPVGTFLLKLDRVRNIYKLQYKRELLGNRVVTTRPEVAMTIKPMPLSEKVRVMFSGEVGAAIIDNSRLETLKGRALAKVETPLFEMGPNLTLKLGGEAGYSIYGTGDSQCYLEGQILANFAFGNKNTTIITYAWRDVYGSSPFSFDAYQPVIRGAATIKLGDIWKFDISGHLRDGYFSNVKYELRRNLHCFEASVSWDPIEGRWDAKIGLTP